MKLNTATLENIACPTEQLRAKVAEARTTLLGSDVYDKNTGEYYGTYIEVPFSPGPLLKQPDKPTRLKERWYAEEDGTPRLLQDNPSSPPQLAPIIELFPRQSDKQPEQKSRAGKKPQVIDNPLADTLSVLRFEGHHTPWLDDFAFGAIYMGPGLIGGRHSVSLADVKRVLRIHELSVAAAAECLCNHDREPMSTRQIQRVIQAARTALRGIALHLERHPHIAESVGMTINFDTLWPAQGERDPTTVPCSKKYLALEMRRAGAPIKTVARELGISKNTVKAWDKGSLPVAEGGGQ